MHPTLFFPVFLVTTLLSFFLTAFATSFLLVRLQRRKIGQTILEIGPKWHKSKEGTPTMGGIAFLLTSLLLSIAFFLLYRSDFVPSTLLNFGFTVVFVLANGAIGLLDDLLKHHNKRNEGLRARSKFLLQAILCALYLLALSRFSLIDSSLFLPFWKTNLELGILFYPFAFFFLVGIVNSVNLTDGIDGLAASVTMVVAGLLCVLCVRAQNGSGLFLSACTVGICIAFLLFNAHPARMFMGDTGSLFLGAMIASLALYTDCIPVICIGGAFYLLEAVSVILQVGYFKLSGKRLFKMAPFHHHLEQCGYSESKVVLLAVTMTLLLCAIAYFSVS